MGTLFQKGSEKPAEQPSNDGDNGGGGTSDGKPEIGHVMGQDQYGNDAVYGGEIDYSGF